MNGEWKNKKRSRDEAVMDGSDGTESQQNSNHRNADHQRNSSRNHLHQLKQTKNHYRGSNTNDQRHRDPRNHVNDHNRHHRNHQRHSSSDQSRRNTNELPPNAKFDSDSDPFLCALRPEIISEHQQRVLWWHAPVPFLPARIEESMLGTLIRWRERERGMMKDQPLFRLEQIEKLCHRHEIPIELALSLRRSYLKHYNPYRSMTQLGLGDNDSIRESARIFEECVQDFITRQGVEFWTETEHKDHISRHLQPGDPYPPTPDFVFKKQIRIRKFVHREDRRDRSSSKRKHVLEEWSVGWMEAKMFYGASTLPQDGKGAVGNVLSTAEKYCRVYGPGAIVFMQGCGEELAQRLAEAGVLALDCSSRKETVQIEPVRAHQRTWCANDQGRILP